MHVRKVTFSRQSFFPILISLYTLCCKLPYKVQVEVERGKTDIQQVHAPSPMCMVHL